MCPSAQRGWIGQARRIFAVRHCLLNGITRGDALTSLLSTAQAERRCWREPIGQNREGLVARMTDSTSNPNVIMLVIVTLTVPPSVADDREFEANRTPPWQETQRHYPGSMLPFASGSAMKIITAA